MLGSIGSIGVAIADMPRQVVKSIMAPDTSVNDQSSMAAQNGRVPSIYGERRPSPDTQRSNLEEDPKGKGKEKGESKKKSSRKVGS